MTTSELTIENQSHVSKIEKELKEIEFLYNHNWMLYTPSERKAEKRKMQKMRNQIKNIVNSDRNIVSIKRKYKNERRKPSRETMNMFYVGKQIIRKRKKG